MLFVTKWGVAGDPMNPCEFCWNNSGVEETHDYSTPSACP